MTLDLGTLMLISGIACISIGGGWLISLVRRPKPGRAHS